MIKQILIVLFLILQLSSTNAKLMDLILLDQTDYPDAACIDGSRAGFYFQEGQGSGENKWVIFFEGGGVCFGTTPEEVIKSCYNRTFTPFGSSKFRPKKWKGWAILQDSEKKNPDYYNWNKVYIFYCDGILHQGFRQDPWEYKGKHNVYIKGYSSTQAIFDYLIANKGLAQSNIEEVLLTGSSAGGVATYTYGDILKDKLNQNTKYYISPDSGFFIDSNLNGSSTEDSFFTKTIKSLIQVFDYEQYLLPAVCRNSDNPAKCMQVSNWVQGIESDMYIVNSEYDAFQLPVFEGITCIKHRSLQNCDQEQLNKIAEFRQSFLSQVYTVLEQKKNANAWLVSCYQHTFFTFSKNYNKGLFQVPNNSGFTPQNALFQWKDQTPSFQNDRIDFEAWPSNEECSGLTTDEEENMDYMDEKRSVLNTIYGEFLNEIEIDILAQQWDQLDIDDQFKIQDIVLQNQ